LLTASATIGMTTDLRMQGPSALHCGGGRRDHQRRRDGLLVGEQVVCRHPDARKRSEMQVCRRHRNGEDSAEATDPRTHDIAY
jgi:putative hemolysin